MFRNPFKKAGVPAKNVQSPVKKFEEKKTLLSETTQGKDLALSIEQAKITALLSWFGSQVQAKGQKMTLIDLHQLSSELVIYIDEFLTTEK